MNVPLFALVCILQLSVLHSWEYVNELRLGGELRVANEGLAHDDTHWIVSNQHFLYRTSIQPMKIEVKNYQAIPEALREISYNHIGDIDVLDNIIYGGIEANDGNGTLAAWYASNLTFIRYTITQQKDMPWVAVQADQRKIYSAVWGACCDLQVYDLDTFKFVGTFSTSGLPSEIQGGAFYNGDLYLSSNLNVSVWRVDMTTGNVSFVLSDDYIERYTYEMEGLDFWDLEERNLGTMHLYGNFMEVKEKAVRNYKV